MLNGTLRTGLALALAVPLCFGSGCKNGDDIGSHLDNLSRERLAAVPDGETVLVSFRAASDLDNLPLGESGRTLGRGDGTVLVDVPRSALADLAGQSGISEAVIWGRGTVAQRLGFALRNQLLEVAYDPARHDEPLSLIATFAPGTPDARAAVEKLGGNPRTLSGNILTLDASIDEAFAILSLPGLLKLSRPSMQRPLGR